MNVTYQNGWAVPAGWKLVPEKPTYELECEVGGVRMDEEFFLDEYADHEKIGEICRAVVKYSPLPPKAPDYNPGPLEVSVVGMPEFDALLDHIYEEGTGSEGVVHLANKLVRSPLHPPSTTHDAPGRTSNKPGYNRRNRSGNRSRGWSFSGFILDFLQMNTHDNES